MYILFLFTIQVKIVHKSYYTYIILNILVIHSYHVIMPYAYGWVRSECNCSMNLGADGVSLPMCIDGHEYSYSLGGASSYCWGKIGG